MPAQSLQLLKEKYPEFIKNLKSSAEDDRPFETEDCKKCKCITWFFAGNDRGFCGGFPQKPKPEVDVIRFCLVSGTEADFIDLKLGEALEMSCVFATCAEEYITKVLKPRIKLINPDLVRKNMKRRTKRKVVNEK